MRYLVLISLFVTACTTYVHDEGRQKYINKIQRYSAGDKQFSGLYENFEFRSTVLNHEVTKTIHDRKQEMYDWSETESSEKLSQQLGKLESTTRLWLSFFTPNRKDDNLATDRSIWKIYLIAGSQRYEGRAIKANVNLSEAKELYPYHTRWATPYYVEFPVASSDVENEELQLIITGPLGRREVQFPSSTSL